MKNNHTTTKARSTLKGSKERRHQREDIIIEKKIALIQMMMKTVRNMANIIQVKEKDMREEVDIKAKASR